MPVDASQNSTGWTTQIVSEGWKGGRGRMPHPVCLWRCTDLTTLFDVGDFNYRQSCFHCHLRNSVTLVFHTHILKGTFQCNYQESEKERRKEAYNTIGTELKSWRQEVWTFSFSVMLLLQEHVTNVTRPQLSKCIWERKAFRYFLRYTWNVARLHKGRWTRSRSSARGVDFHSLERDRWEIERGNKHKFMFSLSQEMRLKYQYFVYSSSQLLPPSH